LVIITGISGSTAMTSVDMPSMESCKLAANELQNLYQRDTSARCVSRESAAMNKRDRRGSVAGARAGVE